MHGEYSFLCEHARLARETAGIHNVSVIKNGTMLGVQQLRNAATVSTGSASANMLKVVGEVDLINFYNDGGKGTGTAQEMAIAERTSLAFEGIVVVALDVYRGGPGGGGGGLRCRCRLTTRGMWTDGGNLLAELHKAAEGVVARQPFDVTLAVVERQVIDAVKRACKTFNSRMPEVIAIAHENDPRAAHIPVVAAAQQGRAPQPWQQQQPYQGRSGSGPAAAKPWERAPLPSSPRSAPVARTPDEQSEGEGASSSSSDESPAEMSPKGEAQAPRLEVSQSESSRQRESAVKHQLLEARKKVVRRKTTPAAAPTAGSGPPLQRLPEGVLEKRKLSNPRDQPSKENDTDYG